MSPVITFGGLLGEATEGRIVSTKNGSSQAFRFPEASDCVHLSPLFFYLYLKTFSPQHLISPIVDVPQLLTAVENMKNMYV